MKTAKVNFTLCIIQKRHSLKSLKISIIKNRECLLSHPRLYITILYSLFSSNLFSFTCSLLHSAAAFLTSAFFAAGFDLATAFSFITGSLASAAFLTVVFFAASAFACHLATSFSNSVISSPGS